jgi:hypothetical protein
MRDLDAFEIAKILAKSTENGLVYLDPRSWDGHVHQNLVLLRDVCRDKFGFGAIDLLGKRQYIVVANAKEANALVKNANFDFIRAHFFDKKGDIVSTNFPGGTSNFR